MVKLGAISLALFALVALLVPTGPSHFERSWAEAMTDLRTPFLTHVALVCNWLGRGFGRALVIGVAGVVLLLARRWAAAVTFAIVEVATPVVNSLVRVAVDRPRPVGGIVHPSGASFPSGHTSFAAVTSVVLVLLVARRRRAWWAVAAAVTLAMAWSRTYLGAHWLLDVVAGAILGLGVALSVFAAVSDGTFTARLHRGR